MAWMCLDCGNKSTRKFSAGRCPACDSFNISGGSSALKDTKTRSVRRKKIDLTILFLCWGSLAWLLLNKLL